MNAHQWKATLHPDNIQAAQLKDEIHIWVASLDQSIRWLTIFEQMLSVDERQRARRFYFERDQRRFVAGRGMLRVTIGRYLGLEPQKVQFQYSKNGKPFLPPQNQQASLEFNLSHSGELALYALTRNRRIGIDVEILNPVPQAEEIASQFFSANECASIVRLPETLRTNRFLELWTCKEAYIKALGEGLSHPLNQFEITQISRHSKSIVRLDRPIEEAGTWSITSFRPENGYEAALAADDHDWQLKFGQWNATEFLRDFGTRF
jgi:4'-phosphopantetheinyl transferase